MIEDIVNEIKQAEQQADELVQRAREQSRINLSQGVNEAKAQAERIEQEAGKKAQELLSLAQQRAHDDAQQHIEQRSRQIGQDVQRARQNLDAAVELILQRVR